MAPPVRATDEKGFVELLEFLLAEAEDIDVDEADRVIAQLAAAAPRTLPRLAEPDLEHVHATAVAVRNHFARRRRRVARRAALEGTIGLIAAGGAAGAIPSAGSYLVVALGFLGFGIVIAVLGAFGVAEGGDWSSDVLRPVADLAAAAAAELARRDQPANRQPFRSSVPPASTGIRAALTLPSDPPEAPHDPPPTGRGKRSQ